MLPAPDPHDSQMNTWQCSPWPLGSQVTGDFMLYTYTRFLKWTCIIFKIKPSFKGFKGLSKYETTHYSPQSGRA